MLTRGPDVGLRICSGSTDRQADDGETLGTQQRIIEGYAMMNALTLDSALNALDVLGQLKDRDVALHMIDLGGDVTGNGISKLVLRSFRP